MATWEDLKAHARTQFTLDVDEAHEFAVTVERTEAGQVRAQRVMVRHYEAWGDSMIEFRSAFGEVGQYDPQGLLRDNLNLPLGAVAQHGQYLVLVHRTPLVHTSVDAALYLLTRVSLLADVLEARGGGDRF